MIGPETRTILLTNQMKTDTNNDLVARVFPRFRQFGCFYFEFSCAFKGILRRCDWFGFGFTAPLKSALFQYLNYVAC